jgi:6-methylsalicylate decarboxylase
VTAALRTDVHAHFFDAPYLDLLDRLGVRSDVTAPGRQVLAASPEQDLAERFAALDEAGIGRQILSISGVAPYHEAERAAVEGARYANDRYAELAAAHPERLAFFAVLPMPHVAASLAELERALDLGALGVTMTTSVLGSGLDDPRFDPIFAELDRRGSVVFIHPTGLACESPMLRGFAWPLGAPVEDTLCALQLMKSGFPRRFPRVKMILPHLGGVLPFLLERLDRSSVRSMPNEERLSLQVRLFWYDTCNGHPDALVASIHAYGIERILFGTDYPYWKDDAFRRAVEYVGLSGLSDDECAAIEHGNAARMFGDGTR